MSKKQKLLFKAGTDWTAQLLDDSWTEIEKIAKEELKISYYKPQIEIVSAHQMLDAYSSIGLPIYYKHWSFGKDFVQNEKAYKSGQMGLAYELVINSNPCIAYLMEENNVLVQTLVMAHASVGHSAVFKNNYLFKERTDADGIIDYLSFAKNFLKKCEERYGFDEVEHVLDACHSLQTYGVDKYKKPPKLSAHQEELKALEKFEQELDDYDHVWEKVGAVQRAKLSQEKEANGDDSTRLSESQENILYFLEKNAPHLPRWKREIIRINRKLSEYFYPQRCTKVLNEGYASFCHYYILNRMYDKGLLDAGSMMEFYALHSGVLRQHRLSHFNPYKLGFMIFMDIKRMCENPTDEDRKYFPNLVGKDWAEEVNYAMMNFKDETFILQYLSPKVARDLQLFSIFDEDQYVEEYEVKEISNESGFYELRAKLAAQYALENLTPDIQVVAVDAKGTRKLTLEHSVKRGVPLHLPDARLVTKYVSDLWEYTVQLRTVQYDDESGEMGPLTITELGRYAIEKPSEVTLRIKR